MIAKHLTDYEMQQYALDSSNYEMKIVEHVEQCEECKATVASYQLLFSAIKQQAIPAFDFNLPEMVLAQLPPPKSRFSAENKFAYKLALVITLLTGVFLYIIRAYLVSLYTGITQYLIYLILPAIITILLILCIDMHKNYQKKMKVLDFY
jgi:hypothetical protein